MRFKLSPRLLIALPLVLVAQATSPAVDASKAFASHLTALRDTKILEAKFVCEKRLAALETPLVSRGRLWVRRGDPRDGDGAVRFTTENPYVSDLILAKGKTHARSQHETEWTQTNQSTRPGLSAVMAQLGGWATGDVGKITDAYTITASTEAIPEYPAGDSPDKPPAPADLFTLTPTNKDLAKLIKHITLAIDRTSHHLVYIEILTQQDDVNRYWFYDIRTNVELPANIFTPTAAPAAPAAAPAKDKP